MTQDLDPDFETMLEFLRDVRGFDFTGYKRPSLMRRVCRRMEQVQIERFADYQDFLTFNADEFTALFDTILINVTGFFRDAEAWTQLSTTVVPEMLKGLPEDDPIRVWTAGCASGEEAYSIAMALAEALSPEVFRDRVKIYATDVDEGALSVARSAAYGEREMRNVPVKLRERYFEPAAGNRWTFRPDYRRCVIFGRNDLVVDAPISRVDLLVCRNTLMYFNALTQAKVLERFHFSLRPHGVLFLGKAEMLLSHGNLFSPIDYRRRFFRAVPRPGTGPLTFTPRSLPGRPADSLGIDRLRHQAMMASPVATLLVSADGVLAAMNPRAESMFGLSAGSVGRPVRELEVAFRPVALSVSLDQVFADREPVWLREIEWVRAGDDRLVLDLMIEPLLSAGGEVLGIAVMGTDVTHYLELQSDLETTNRQLETAYEELQSTVEELETTNEELQSTVEELETTNEELQSSNEELETMNEEQHSTNDELRAVNDELRDRTQQLRDTSEYMEAILASLRSGVVVVDTDYVVRTWNVQAEDMWGLRAEEVIGRPLLSLDSGLPVEAVRPMIRRLLANEPGGELRLSALNRRGRTVDIRIVGTALRPDDGPPTAAVLLLDDLSTEDPAAG
jgi:two-component system, chemotaxis family, CheB/CheR fusion protein